MNVGLLWMTVGLPWTTIDNPWIGRLWTIVDRLRMVEDLWMIAGLP